jgi:hypothetical protein
MTNEARRRPALEGLYTVQTLARFHRQERVPYDIPCPPKVGRIEARLPCVYPFTKFIVSETGNPHIQQRLSYRDMREAAMDEHCVVKTQEDHEVNRLEDFQIPWNSEAADCRE